jgi:addiction module RelB/DinJ family antitoxin
MNVTTPTEEVRVMVSDTYVRARIDKVTKERAADALGDMGLTISDAIRALLLRIAEEHRMPFEIRAPGGRRVASGGAWTNERNRNHALNGSMLAGSLDHYQLLHEHFKQFVPHSVLGRRLVRLREEIMEIALHHHASNLRVFGAVAKGEDVPSSNLDLLVDLEDPSDLENLLDLQKELQALLGVRVDAVTEKALRPHTRSAVLAEASAL